ncbi:MAG: 30S ribosomal protein S9 [Planctomycetes bacterium]|nr:30S ribosomal protein S9 [Planctomycetota bacterium]
MAEETTTTTATIEKPGVVKQQVRSAGPDKAGFYWGTGRRKTAVARVRLKAGSGKVSINGREVAKFFTEIRDQTEVALPLKVTKMEASVDVFANVRGGGYMGQAGAVKLGIARALKGFDATLEPMLREHDLLTRDARAVERKKYGQAGARRRYQFSKR